MIQTFTQLRDKVLAWIDEFGDTDTTLRLVNNALQAAHQAVLLEHKWNFMKWARPITLTTVVGQQVYPLHQAFGRPDYFFNRTSKKFVEEVKGELLKTAGVNWNTATGEAEQFRFFGRSAVAAQPTAASVLTATSTIGADNSNRSITVYGDTPNGLTSEQIAAGATGVIAFSHIISVRKNDTWAGRLDLKAGAQTLLSLFPAEAGRNYPQIQLLTEPTAAEVIEYNFFRTPAPFSADNDVPDLPPGFHDILVWEALLQFATYNQMESKSVDIWGMNRQRLFLALQQHDSGGQSLDAAHHYTTYIER